MTYSRGTPGFSGIKLTQARMLRRIKMTTLADELGLSRAAVSAYEKDRRTPSPEVMGEICQYLDVPLNFFVSGFSYISEEDVPTFYRSHKAALRLARDSAEIKSRILSSIAEYLEQYVDFPEINLPQFDVPSDPTELSDDYIRDIAERTRSFWGLSLGPISDLVCLLENNGILVGSFPFKCEKLDSFSHFIDKRPQVIIGSDHGTLVRQRFNASHELAHLILHRKVPKELAKDDAFHNVIERQAHYFGFEFLFPTKAFKSEVKRFTINEFLRLKRKWKVSVQSQIKKASQPDIAGRVETAPLFRSLARNGWKTFEPYDDEYPCEEPKLIREAFDLILNAGIQSPKDISNHFSMHFSDIEEIAGLPQGYFSGFGEGRVLQLKEKYRESSVSEASEAKTEPKENLSKDKSTVLSFMDAFAQRK